MLFEGKFEACIDVLLEGTVEMYGGTVLKELVEFELGVGAYGSDARLEVAFAIGLVRAGAHAPDPSRRQSADSRCLVAAATNVEVMFARIELGAATYGVDVELE